MTLAVRNIPSEVKSWENVFRVFVEQSGRIGPRQLDGFTDELFDGRCHCVALFPYHGFSTRVFARARTHGLKTRDTGNGQRDGW